MLRLLFLAGVLMIVSCALFGLQIACEPINLGPVNKSEVGKKWSKECLDHYNPNKENDE